MGTVEQTVKGSKDEVLLSIYSRFGKSKCQVLAKRLLLFRRVHQFWYSNVPRM